VIVLPDSGADGDAWLALCELANGFAGRWCLIGARMVELHGLHHGQSPPRRSADLDTLCGAKAVGSRPRDLVAWLREHGFDSDGVSADGIGHRYRRGDVFIDVLAPDHLGSRADLTVEDGIRTIAVPGGRRVLNHLIALEVRCALAQAHIPVPSLAGALIAKSLAVDVDDAPANQRIDLAFLHSLVNDVTAVRAELGPEGSKLLARRTELADRHHPAWRATGARAQDAYDAFRFLTRP
jgi:hypothetical protein